MNGAEYLFTARDEPEVSLWVSAINSAIAGAESFTRETKTMPPIQSRTTNVGENSLKNDETARKKSS